MKRNERRIKRFIAKRPGSVLLDIAEYLGKDIQTTRRILLDMKERGLIVGKSPDEEGDK